MGLAHLVERPPENELEGESREGWISDHAVEGLGSSRASSRGLLGAFRCHGGPNRPRGSQLPLGFCSWHLKLSSASPQRSDVPCAPGPAQGLSERPGYCGWPTDALPARLLHSREEADTELRSWAAGRAGCARRSGTLGRGLTWRRAPAPQPGRALLLLLLLLSASGASEVFLPSLFQPLPSVVSGQGNPQIQCVVRGSPVRAHVLSWYQQLVGHGPTFLLSQRVGAPPTYGLGVNPRFLAELDLAQNGARLTVGNAGPDDEGTYYCAMWFSGRYVFGEGTRLLYQDELQSPALQPPQLSLFVPASDPPSLGLCVALGHHPAPLRVSWVLRGQHQEEEDFTGEAGDPVVSWLQLPQEVAGMTMTCQSLHQSGASEVVLSLPLSWGQGCRRLELQNWNDTHGNSGDTLLAELKQTLSVITYCYLGLLGAAQFYNLILVALWRNRGSQTQEG